MNTFSKFITYSSRSVQFALLVASVLVILFPALRIGSIRSTFWVLFYATCTLGTYESWKAGHLTKTPRQIYEHARGRPALSPLDKISFGVAVVAIVVLMTTS